MSSRLHCSGKLSWPELKGTKGKAAAKTIEKENPHVNAIILAEGSPVTLDFRCDRVRVFVKPNGIVAQTPVVT